VASVSDCAQGMPVSRECNVAAIVHCNNDGIANAVTVEQRL